MKLNKFDIIIGLLIIAEIALCVYIGFSNEDNYFCSVGSDCDAVQNSIYGTFLGVKLAWFGVICFSILLLLFLIARVNKNYYWIFFLASIIGTGLAVYFILLQVFILGKLCRDCVIIDGIMILMFIIVVFEFIDFRKEIKDIEYNAEKIIRKAL